MDKKKPLSLIFTSFSKTGTPLESASGNSKPQLLSSKTNTQPLSQTSLNWLSVRLRSVVVGSNPVAVT